METLQPSIMETQQGQTRFFGVSLNNSSIIRKTLCHERLFILEANNISSTTQQFSAWIMRNSTIKDHHFVVFLNDLSIIWNTLCHKSIHILSKLFQ